MGSMFRDLLPVSDKLKVLLDAAKPELVYWGETVNEGAIYIHRKCPVTHDEVVQRFGKPSGTILIGVNPYVRASTGVCDFCGKKFDFSPGVIK